MTVRGRLREGAPRVSVRVRFGGGQWPCWFLVDTGAERTTLLDRDLDWIGLPPGSLTPLPSPILGFGGPVRASLLPGAELVLHAAERDVVFRHDLCVVRHDISRFPHAIASRILGLPSVLGRDIIDHFRFVYEHATGTVLLER